MSLQSAGAGISTNTCSELVTSEPSELVTKLRARIRKLETEQRSQHGPVISTGADLLDRCLPENGLAPGTVTEWLQPAAGYGAEILSLIAARNACFHSRFQHRNTFSNRKTFSTRQTFSTRKRKQHNRIKALVVVDPEGVFYPAAAVMWGIHLKHTIVIRNAMSNSGMSNSGMSNLVDGHGKTNAKSMSKILWAIHQALQCDAVGAVWSCLPQLSQKWSRRFQLAAEQHGTMAMLVRPQKRISSQASWAEVQWLIEPNPISSFNESRRSHESRRSFHSRTIRLKLHRARGGQSGSISNVEVDFTTGNLQATPICPTTFLAKEPSLFSSSQPVQKNEANPLHLVSQLAHPKTRRRATRA